MIFSIITFLKFLLYALYFPNINACIIKLVNMLDSILGIVLAATFIEKSKNNLTKKS